jgi:hypothetical protein
MRSDDPRMSTQRDPTLRILSNPFDFGSLVNNWKQSPVYINDTN